MTAMNDRRATTAFPLHDLLAERWSPRGFSERALAPEDLGSLLEAVRWSPSCFNEQPCGYLVGVAGDETHARIAELLVPPNREWAERAPLLMIACARMNFTRNGKPNRHAVYDLGQASALLTVQAQALGLVVHQMGGFDADGTGSVFGLPDDVEAYAALAVGYHDPDAPLSERAAAGDAAQRERRPLGEVAFADAWGSAHPLAASR